MEFRVSLEGRSALVTGASGGLGAYFAERLAAAGARVAVAARRVDACAALCARIRDAGGDALPVALDVTDPASAARAVAEVTDAFGSLDILVNNAGVAKHGETETFPEAEYRRLMDINVDSVFRACQAALGPMRRQKSGVILNIGSISGLISNIPQPQAAYNASKAAVHMLTKSLASDYAEEGIRANAIAPGYITTDMTNGGLADPVWGPVWRDMTPMKRPGSAMDIGAAALYLCSPASNYVTGEVLVIDGGYTVR